MDFRLHAWRFEFRARESIHFPEGKSGNILRGAFGLAFRKLSCVPECVGATNCGRRESCPYARIFEPHAEQGPSGLVDSPRPFVFRAMHLDGCTIRRGELFHFDLHLFDTRSDGLEYFVAAFREVARDGLGPRRGSAELTAVSQPDAVLFDPAHSICRAPVPIALPLDSDGREVTRIRLTFLTPTELKSGNAVADQPGFGIVYGRARDRVSTLRRLYGDGPLEHDFRETLSRANTIHMAWCELRYVDAERRSSRTGQTHPLGGFVGEAEYEGQLGEFLPVLRIAQWTGIGRQTVWGKGAIRVHEATKSVDRGVFSP